MPLCRVGDYGCGCSPKKRQQEVCITVAIPDSRGNPIAYESCKVKCVKGKPAYPGGPLLSPGARVPYPGGPILYPQRINEGEYDNV